MSDILNKVNQIGLNADFPISGQNNSTEGFRQNSRATLAGLTTANDELSRIQKTSFRFTGDGAGITSALGQATVQGANDPRLDVQLTLANVLSNAGTLNTHENYYSLSFDSKGRLVVIGSLNHSIDWAAGHQANQLLDVQGNIKDNLVFPVYQFDNSGRVVGSRTRTVSFSLVGQKLTSNSLLVGNNSVAEELSPPTGGGNYTLAYNGSTISWQPVVPAASGQIVNVVGGRGIKTENTQDSATVHLDLTKLSPTIDLQDSDQLVIQDISENRAGLVSLVTLKNRLAKVKLDTDPELGGPLDVGSQFLWSTTGTTVIQSAKSSPKAKLTVSESGLSLTGKVGAPVLIDAPNLLLNGVRFPSSVGTRGQALYLGVQGLEWNTPDNFDNALDGVVFVAPNGDDTSSGSMNRPLLTIGAAIDKIPQSSNNLWSIVLLGGTYNEDLVFENKRKVSLESLFHSGPATITGTLKLDFGVDEFYMNNITWDSRATTRDPTLAIWSIQYGLAKSKVRDCSFLRQQGNQLALAFNGQTTGPMLILDCEIQGTIRNEMAFSEDGMLVVESLREKLDKNIPVFSATEERELMLTDSGRYLRVNISTDNSLLVPDQTEVPFSIGATIRISQSGTGRTSVVPKGNAIINTPNGYILRKRFSSALLTYVGQDIWDLSGDLDETIVNSPAIRADSGNITMDNDQITVDNG